MASTPRKTSRRQFLAGQAALQAVEDALPSEVSAPPSRVTNCKDSYLVQVGRTAMACDFDVFLNAGQHAGATESALAALDLVDVLESQMTVYRSTSEVLEINRNAARGPMRVEERLFQLLMRAVEIYRETNGAFDITSGPLSQAWGFFKREGRYPAAEEITSALERVGSHWLQLDATANSIQFGLPTLQINLNAIGKGYALDRAAAMLEERCVKDFLIHGGKSSVLARGSRADKSTAKGWLVALRNPLRPDRQLAELNLTDRALGTSGAGNQFFYFQGRRYGHIIDPRTGYPADRVLSATVLAPDGATADALATAFFVLGVEDALAICSTHPDLAAILVVPGQRSGEVEVISTGLTEAELRLLE